MLSITLLVVVFLALAFDFINGFHDTANSIATSVSTRVLTPRMAIIMAAGLNFVGALMSHNVAKTISKGLVDNTGLANSEYIVIAALLAAIIWNLVTWYFGIPSSSSHAIVGGLLGSSIAYASSLDVVIWGGVLNKVILPLLTSPIVGFILGFIFMKMLYTLLKKAAPNVINKYFSKLQIISAAFMSFTHGMNDAQKSMGIITFALVGAGLQKNDEIQPWVMILCALAMALGTSIGGWKIIKTMGVNMIRLQPINGFAAEAGAAIVIGIASLSGQTVSTTHVISTSIMGVGASKRISAVRWALARNIVWTWVLTIPVTASIGAVVILAIKLFV